MNFKSQNPPENAEVDMADATRLASVTPTYADHMDTTRVAHSPSADSEATRIAPNARRVDLETEGTRIRATPAASLIKATEHEIAERYQIGEKIGDRYEVLAIHRGTMGVVYGTFDHEERLPRALKTLQQRYARDEGMQDLFAAEAATWVKLEKHPFIVRAYLVRSFFSRHAYSGERDRSFRLNVTAAHEMVLRG